MASDWELCCIDMDSGNRCTNITVLQMLEKGFIRSESKFYLLNNHFILFGEKKTWFVRLDHKIFVLDLSFDVFSLEII